MADRIALWGRDIDESPPDGDLGHISIGRHEPATEPIPVIETDEPRPAIVRSAASAGTTLTFKPAPAPWYRTRRGLIVLVGVIAVAVVLALLPMLLRSPASEKPVNVTPTTAPAPPTGVQPTSASVVPTLTSRPAPPPPAAPPPPPPPPPVADAPVYTGQYQAPRYSEPAPAKPEIGVTRAPISVAPKPVTPPTSADVGAHGDNPGRRW